MTACNSQQDHPSSLLSTKLNQSLLLLTKWWPSINVVIGINSSIVYIIMIIIIVFIGITSCVIIIMGRESTVGS